MLNTIVIYGFFILILGPIVYVGMRALSECTGFTEQQRVLWKSRRQRSKIILIGLPSLMVAVAYFLLNHLLEPYLKRQRGLADQIGGAILIASIFFIGQLADWRTNELKYQGKIPRKWRAKNNNYEEPK